MNEVEIANALACTPTFMGVLAKDELNKIKKFGSYIMNFDDSKSGGSHWLGLYLKEREMFYFDSYGVSCPTYIIDFASKRNISSIVYNNLQLQSVESKQCGNFCVEFCKTIDRYGANKQSFHDFVTATNNTKTKRRVRRR